MKELINPLPPDAFYLYHYTSTETALNYILKNGTLMFNSFQRVNDPRESKQWEISTMVNGDLNLEPKDYDLLSREVSQVLKGNAKVICFSRDKDEAVGKWQPAALLDRGFAKPSMWHHYANRHNGLCLMFDKIKLEKAFKKKLDEQQLVSGRVIYSHEGILRKHNHNDPFFINLMAVSNVHDYLMIIQNHLNRWFTELFLRKLPDWQHEDEYRWIYLDNNPEPLYIAFEDALKGIIVGNAVPRNIMNEIMKHCVYYTAGIAEMNWSNGFPKVEHGGRPYLTHRHLLDEK